MTISTIRNIEYYSGRSVDIVVTVTDADGSDYDLGGYTLTYITEDRTGATLFTKSSNVGSEIVINDNVVTIYIDPADTANTYGGHFHELMADDGGGNKINIVTGRADILRSLQ